MTLIDIKESRVSGWEHQGSESQRFSSNSIDQSMKSGGRREQLLVADLVNSIFTWLFAKAMFSVAQQRHFQLRRYHLCSGGYSVSVSPTVWPAALVLVFTS
jgi:hypothetical protein